jgi:hypothetical protein
VQLIQRRFGRANKGKRVRSYKEYIDECIVNIDSSSFDESLKNLTKYVYKKSNLDISLTQNWWFLFFDYLLNRVSANTNISSCYDNLYKETLRLNLSNHSAKELLEVYALLLEYGMYEIGYVFRIECSSIFIKEATRPIKKDSLIKLRPEMAAAFELGNRGVAFEIFQKMTSLFKNKGDLFALCSFFKILYKEFDDIALCSGIENDMDHDFSALINGKSIAVAGPLTGSNDIDEINGHDLVVRFSYSGEDFLTRTDISYYNGIFGDFLMEGKRKLPNDLKVAVFRHNVEEKVKSLPDVYKRHIMGTTNYFMLDCNGTALQHTLTDLLLYSPSVIKVFGCDVHSTFHRKYPRSYGTMPYKERSKVFVTAGVDPFSQYKFLEFLYNNDLIEGDAMFRKVMSWKVKKYMQVLQKEYDSFF